MATDEYLIALVDAGLGNSTYIVDLGDGRALAVDASIDLRAVHETVRHRGLKLAYAVETHLHADFVSGAIQLAHDHGATVLASAAGGRSFPHVGVSDNQTIDLGGLSLLGLATPGHTYEHIAFALMDGERTLGVFSGGSLLVDAAARTDLLGKERADELARAQFRSLHRLSMLPDEAAVWPTHGAGSFCAAPASSERVSTIGQQRLSNPLLHATNESQFVEALKAGFVSYPTYFDHLSEVNRLGPALLPAAHTVPDISIEDVTRLVAGGAWVVDVRPARDFAAAHIPGAISIPLRDQFASWLGWIVPWNAPLVFVLGDSQSPAEVFYQARKVGYERLLGRLAGGVDSWRNHGREVSSVAFVTADQITTRPVVDVRQHGEHWGGHIPDAAGIELGALVDHLDEVAPDTVVACAHGERAMTAASLLHRAGHTDVAALDGGPGDWAASTGLPLSTGSKSTDSA